VKEEFDPFRAAQDKLNNIAKNEGREILKKPVVTKKRKQKTTKVKFLSSSSSSEEITEKMLKPKKGVSFGADVKVENKKDTSSLFKGKARRSTTITMSKKEAKKNFAEDSFGEDTNSLDEDNTDKPSNKFTMLKMKRSKTLTTKPVAKLVLPPHFRETMTAFELMLDDQDINKETVELLIQMYT